MSCSTGIKILGMSSTNLTKMVDSFHAEYYLNPDIVCRKRTVELSSLFQVVREGNWNIFGLQIFLVIPISKDVLFFSSFCF